MKPDVDPYAVVMKYEDESGYIFWRKGTGSTIELLDIKAHGFREGRGTKLIKYLLLNVEPTTSSVYGFTRSEYIDAQSFYKKIGFQLLHLPDYYTETEGDGYFFFQSYSKLRQKMGL